MLKPCETMKKGERLDDLMLNGLGIIQDPEVFCFGIDAVLLSDFASNYATGKCLDLCCGNGIIPILMSAKSKADKLFGIEIQPDSVDLAKRSIEYNDLSNKVDILEGDLRNIEKYFPTASFDCITANPPYIKISNGLLCDSSVLNVARHEISCNLLDVIKAAKKMLKSKGRLFMIHRPGRLVEILKTLSDNGLEPKRLRMIQSFSDKAPKLVLIEARKDSGSEIIVEPALIIYDSPGKYTKEVMEIYGK